jgi:Putative Flp pilus-assembly TadE/G-like
MKLLRGESGQTLVVVALSMTVLIGFVAFAADAGMLFREQRNLQIAADAAAIAGTLDYRYNGSVTSAEAAGLAAVGSNGMTVTTNCSTDTISGDYACINCPPTDGPNNGTIGFCEAVVSHSTSPIMNLFSVHSVNVAARAVAGAGTTQGCIWTLATSGVDIAMTGSGSLNVQKCNVYDDSNASDALDLTGSGSIYAQEIGIVGDPARTGSGNIYLCDPTCETGNPTTGMAVAASPITLSPPTIPTGTATAPTVSGGSAYTCSGTSNCVISPGNYSSITNSSTGTLTFSAGTYNVTGNISNSSSGTIVSNSGTYTFNVGGSITDSGGAMTLGGGTYNVVGNISDSSSGNMTVGAGTYTVNGSIQTTGAGTMTLGAGNYIIGSCLCDTGSGNMTTGAGDYTMATFTSTGSSSLTLGSGLYITTGNQSLTGSGSLTGTSVTFFTEGSTTVSGSGSMSITAPTSGTYNGIAFYMPTTDSNAISITGSGSMTFEGIVYAPKSQLTFSGSGSGTSYADFIVDSLDISGSGSFQSYQTINPSAMAGKIAMVE